MAAFSREFHLESVDISLQLDQKIEGDVSCVVWDAALVLSAYLDSQEKSHKGYLRNKNIVELGSGVGCVGLTAACLGARVIVTDLPDVIPHLKNNISNNHEAVKKGDGRIEVMELDWTQGNLKLCQPDLLLLADCVYYEQALEPLVEVVTSLSGPKTEVLICQELRDSDKQKMLWTKFCGSLEESFVFNTIPREQQHPTFCSPDIMLLRLTKKQRM